MCRFSPSPLLLAAAVLVVALTAGASPGGSWYGVGLAPHMLGTGGDAVEEDLFRYLGQRDDINEVYAPSDAEDFFRILGQIKARGRRINLLVIAGHGSYATPGVGFSAGNLLPAHVDYCRLRRELWNRQRTLSRLPAGAEERARFESEINQLSVMLSLRDQAAGVMAPGGRIIVLSCSVAATPLGTTFLSHLGDILACNGGGDVVGSTVDNTAGQVASYLDAIKVAFHTFSWVPVGDHFFYGNMQMLRVANTRGRILCPDLPEEFSPQPAASPSAVPPAGGSGGWRGSWSVTSHHEEGPAKGGEYPSRFTVHISGASCLVQWGANRWKCQATGDHLTFDGTHPSGGAMHFTFVKNGDVLDGNQSGFRGKIRGITAWGTYRGRKVGS